MARYTGCMYVFSVFQSVLPKTKGANISSSYIWNSLIGQAETEYGFELVILIVMLIVFIYKEINDFTNTPDTFFNFLLPNHFLMASQFWLVFLLAFVPKQGLTSRIRGKERDGCCLQKHLQCNVKHEFAPRKKCET